MNYLFKVILAGDGGVGKSTILKRLLYDIYDPQELTIGLNYGVFETKIDNDTIKLVIWDLGGQKQFRIIHDEFCMGAKGMILVYDLSRKDTFYDLYFWNQFIEEQLIKKNKNIMKILIGNKLDLENYIPSQFIEVFKNDTNIFYDFFTSAKNNINILSTFQKFANLIYKRYKNNKLQEI